MNTTSTPTKKRTYAVLTYLIGSLSDQAAVAERPAMPDPGEPIKVCSGMTFEAAVEA